MEFMVVIEKQFSHKEGVLTFRFTPKVFPPCKESAMSPIPLVMIHEHMDVLV